MVKNPPARQETWGQFLGWEGPWEEGMATYSNILSWRIPTDKGAWQAAVSSWGHKESDMTEQLSTAWHILHRIYTVMKRQCLLSTR